MISQAVSKLLFIRFPGRNTHIKWKESQLIEISRVWDTSKHDPRLLLNRYLYVRPRSPKVMRADKVALACKKMAFACYVRHAAIPHACFTTTENKNKTNHGKMDEK